MSRSDYYNAGDNLKLVNQEPYDPQLQRMMSAPGLTLNMVDKLCRDAWAQGFEEGSKTEREMWQPELSNAHGSLAATKGKVDKVIRERLNHIAHRLHSRTAWQKKSTIKAERDYMAEQANALMIAIKELDNA